MVFFLGRGRYMRVLSVTLYDFHQIHLRREGESIDSSEVMTLSFTSAPFLKISGRTVVIGFNQPACPSEALISMYNQKHRSKLRNAVA